MSTGDLELVPLRVEEGEHIQPFYPVSSHFHLDQSEWRTRISYFLRCVGLGIFSASSFSLLHRHREPKKVVIDTSIWIALAHCCVHVLPVAGSVTLLWLNIAGLYVGDQLSGPGTLSDDVK